MHRIRTTLGSMGATLATLALAAALQAQPPGGPPGGGPGGGGPGGRGGFGGWGGPGGGLMQLALNPAVQEDLKLTDKQKTDLKTASDAIDKKRQDVFKNAGGNRGNRNGGNNANGANGQDPNANAAAPPAQPPMDRETMRATMQNLQTQTDNALAKVLTKPQRARLAEIDLQRQGPMAVFRPEIAEKLRISEEQMAAMQEIRDGMRGQQGEMRKAQGQLFASINQQIQAANGVDPTQAANGNGGGNNGGGRGGRGGGRPDPEQMKTFLANNPEVKAQMDDFAKQGDALQGQTIAAVSDVLTKGQKANFNKMLGKKFDLSKLTGGPGGPPGPTAEAKKDDTATTTAKAGSSAKKSTKKATTSKKKT